MRGDFKKKTTEEGKTMMDLIRMREEIRYRSSDFDLKEVLRAVEEELYRREQEKAHLGNKKPLTFSEIKSLVKDPNAFIPVIKGYRERTGEGLKESKDLVDSYRALLEECRASACAMAFLARCDFPQ